MSNNIVIGAGISGLSFGYFFKDTCLIFEKESVAGGLCKSVKDKGFTFDYSGHFIHIKDKKIKKFLEKILGKKLLTVKRNAAIYFRGRLIPFPFQANLYYLDDNEKKECIKGIEERKNVKIYDDMPFIDWCKAMFGNGITKYFMEPYNQKLWSYDLKKLTAAWTAPFVPKPSAESIIETAYKKNDVKYGYNSEFYYPSEAGCGAVAESLFKKLKQYVLTNVKTENIDWKNKFVFAGGRKYAYDNLISTQPLPELIKQLKNPPKIISNCLRKLSVSSVRCVNIGIKYKRELPKLIQGKHWIYFPDKEYPFYRIGIYSNVCAGIAPKKCYSLYVEFSDHENKYENKCESMICYLKKAGVMNADDEVMTINVIDIPYAYVIFDKNKKKTLEIIKTFLNKNNIYITGRYGAWEYSFMEKNIIDAKNLAVELNKKNEKN
ncbi:MAG: NAD(P)/FAD-dependent oxidoreductase [Endomicrobiaceae bacterium]